MVIFFIKDSTIQELFSNILKTEQKSDEEIIL